MIIHIQTKMGYITQIDEAIKEFTEYKKEAKENKLIFSAIVSRLYNLRTAYFRDLEEQEQLKREYEEKE